MKYVFDVGANDGSSSLAYLKDEDVTVFAFEPNPEMINSIKAKLPATWANDRQRYFIIEKAVSDYEGEAEFNICVTHDRGCSSLLDVSEAGKTQWGGRQDMIPAHKIKVPVIRLDKFIEHYNIPEIEYFHCDTQGSDLRVLKGMGSYISRIKNGVVEAGNKPDILYKGQNTTDETVAYLNSWGFGVTGIHSNDVQNNEVNVTFRRNW